LRIAHQPLFQVHELRRLQEEVRHQRLHRQVRREEAQQEAVEELGE